MDSDGFHASDEENAARELLRQAAILVENSDDLPRGFVAALFGRAAPEDLVDRKSTRLNSSHIQKSRMPSSA